LIDAAAIDTIFSPPLLRYAFIAAAFAFLATPLMLKARLLRALPIRWLLLLRHAAMLAALMMPPLLLQPFIYADAAAIDVTLLPHC